MWVHECVHLAGYRVCPGGQRPSRLVDEASAPALPSCPCRLRGTQCGPSSSSASSRPPGLCPHGPRHCRDSALPGPEAAPLPFLLATLQPDQTGHCVCR